MTTGHEEEEQHPAIARLARETTLAEGALSGARWLGSARVVSQGFQFVVSIITARLLLPSEFGEAALVISIAAFAQIFTDLGLAAAIVQTRRITDELLCSAFWLNFGTGAFLTALFAVLAVPIAELYGNDQLTGLLILASLNFVLACGAVHLALLERSFNFRLVALIETSTTMVGIAVVPILAALGAGVYSLVIGPLTTTVLLSVTLWAVVRWWPTRRPSRRAIRELWAFSRGLVGFNAVNYWSRNLDNLLLGKAVTAAELGEYARAYNLMNVPVQQSSLVLGRAMYPSLSRMQDDSARMARAWGRALGAAGAVTIPLALTMAATAPFLVHVLYGERWSGMVPELELLVLAAIPQIPGAATGVGYRAAGRTDLLFRISLISTALTVCAILIGLRWGTVGVAAALLVRAWVALLVVLVPLARVLRAHVTDLLRPMLRAALPAIPMFAVELVIRALLVDRAPAWLILAVQLIVGGLVYAVGISRSDSEPADALRRRVRRLAGGRRKEGRSRAPAQD